MTQPSKDVVILALCGVIGAGSSQGMHWLQRNERESSEWRELRQGLIDSTASSSRAAGAAEALRDAVKDQGSAVKAVTELATQHQTLITQLAERQKSMDQAIIDQRAATREVDGKLEEMLKLYNELKTEIEKGKKR